MTTTTSDPRLQTLLDKQAIREVVMRYARGVDRMGWELVRSCYHPGAMDERGNFTGPVEEFLPWVQTRLATMQYAMHFLSNSLIALQGDTAWSESYSIAHRRLPAAGRLATDHVCGLRYLDRFERQQGEWRIAHRKVAWEWNRLDPVGRTWNFTAQYIGGKRDRSDLVYERPGFSPRATKSAEEQLQELRDKEAIQAVLRRFARGIDRMDWDLVRSCYHPGAVDEHGVFSGPVEEFLPWASAGMATMRGSAHYIKNALIDVQGDVAYSEAYCLAYYRVPSRNGGDTDHILGLRYNDRFERRQGEWRIAHRKLAWEWSRIDPVGRTWNFRPTFIQGLRDANDPVYDRPGFHAGGTKGTEQRLQELLDKQEIHEVLCRYSQGVDRMDMELVRSCYHDDAFDDHGSYQGSVDGFVEHVRTALATMLGTEHYIDNVLIDVQGDVAYSEAYCLADHRMPSKRGGETDQFLGCRYIDRFERRHRGPWKIAERRVVFDWSRIEPREPSWDFPPEFIRGRRSREDLGYQRM